MGSKCDKVEHLLSDYIDGTLSERKTAAVALHLRSCRSCKREVVGLKKTQHLLENFYVQPEASDAYYARFTTRLHQRIEQSRPTALHQRFFAVATRLGWNLLTRFQRRIDDSRLSGMLSLRQHGFVYYIFGLTLTMLVLTPVLLNQVSSHDDRGTLFDRMKTRFFSTESAASVHPTAALAINQDTGVAVPASIRPNVGSGRATGTPAVDSSSYVWQFTDEPITDGYIFMTLQKNDSETVPSVTLEMDPELLASAELPPQGTFWAGLTDRDVLTANRYAVLLLKDMDAGQHALQQYERKRNGVKGFSQRLLDVPSEILSIPEPYDSKEL